jgi:ribonuclease BN (tRNA processing enzyme)
MDKIRGVDLLVHEAYFADDGNNLPAITGHSSLLPVAQVAAAAIVGRLVLVHINPQIEDDSAFDLAGARRVFKNIQIGVDRMEIAF